MQQANLHCPHLRWIKILLCLPNDASMYLKCWKEYLAVPFLLLQTIFPAPAQTKDSALFSLKPAGHTGITFNNRITESDSLNILTQANIYYGGGVAMADFNKDGLTDLYFAGNMVSNKLYLNKGVLKFDDITIAAGVDGNGRWCTGVSVVDINADGLPDIYACASFRKDATRRTNLLYINQGNNAAGVPIFKEEAARYGLADSGYSTQGYFFDYDHDNDLDLYLVTNELYDAKTPIRFRPKLMDGSASNTDRLYQNNGNGNFSNVSSKAGILAEGWGHAACISDFNQDGWPDVYVANDFVSNDLLYINNKDGTFTNRLNEYFKHTGWNAMGTDAVDINNDGLVDVVSLEMLPEDNMRKKRMLGGNEYYNYTNAEQFGYTHQYVRNVLQVSNGTTGNGHPIFSEVGFMSGLYQTDWSWCPLVADFDNDGFRDLVITNGLPRDVTDLDYISYNSGQVANTADNSLRMAQELPVVKIQNYAFKNNGGLQFADRSNAWGFTASSFSTGAAYGDLDNDGDLDIVMSNINEDAFIYENTSSTETSKQLTISLKGKGANLQAIGTTIHIFYGGNQRQFYEHQPTRGYLSSHDPRVHFGLGAIDRLDSLEVRWPDNTVQLLGSVNTNEVLNLTWGNIEKTKDSRVKNAPLFTESSKRYGIIYKPVEDDFVDYNIQVTLPHKLSQYGPGIAVGDIDNNGWDDFYVGGSSSHPGSFYMQYTAGKFTKDSNRFLQKEDELVEDMGMLFFDVDNDNDLDLYIVSGSYELPPDHPICQDRLYLNNGKGKFLRADSALPQEVTNGSCVRAADFDQDGDLDLFVGGRVVSGGYPAAPKSFLLQNDGGKFSDVTEKYCAGLKTMGMITDALWSDFNNDGLVDLVLTGEWMPVTFLKNTGKSFVDPGLPGNIETHVGWWNSLTAGDFDNDGDIDYVAGNLGLNSNYHATPEQPMTILAKDLDENGSLDAMVFCAVKAEDGTMQSFPMHTRDDLAAQLISIRKKYPTYQSFGRATIDSLWNKKNQEDALELKATDMRSSHIENRGGAGFIMSPLPTEAQVAPVYGMVSEDVDGDGKLDIVLAGNDYGMDPYSGRHDAFNGLVLKGSGKGTFTALPQSQAGFFASGDAKGLAKIVTGKNETALLVTQNQDSLLVYSLKTPTAALPKMHDLKAGDCSADITLTNGGMQYLEFYYGSTFLSQSTRKIVLPANVQKLVIKDFKGSKRTVQLK